MPDLLDEVPEARAFCEAAIADPSPYLLFPQEAFASLVEGVFATDGVDSHGECFTASALKDFADNISRKPLWMLAQHDPRIQPIGRILVAKYFRSDVSGTSFVAGVSGIYDVKSLPTFDDMALTEEPVAGDLAPDVQNAVTVFRIGANPTEIDLQILHDALVDAPELVEKEIVRHFRKALDPLTIITIVVPLYLLAKTPFLKKFQERLGEKAADQTAAALGWIRDQLARTIAARFNRNVLYELVSEERGYRVQFLIDSKDPGVVAEAVEAIEDGVTRAARLLENGRVLGIQKLVYHYDFRESKRWLPLHAATAQHGVISNRPQLIALDGFKGLSLSGTTAQRLSSPTHGSSQPKALPSPTDGEA